MVLFWYEVPNFRKYMQLLCMLYLRRLLMPMSVTSKYEFGMKSTREIVSNAFVAVSKQNNVIKQWLYWCHQAMALLVSSSNGSIYGSINKALNRLKSILFKTALRLVMVQKHH